MVKKIIVIIIQYIFCVFILSPSYSFSSIQNQIKQLNEINQANQEDQTWLIIIKPHGSSVVNGIIEIIIQSTKVVELLKVEIYLNKDIIHTFSSPTNNNNGKPTYIYNWDTNSIYQGGGCIIARGYNDKNEFKETECIPIMIKNDRSLSK